MDGEHLTPPHAPLSEAEIRRVAAAVARAMRRPPPDDPRRDLLSPAHALPPADEDRVAAAVAVIRARAARRGRR